MPGEHVRQEVSWARISRSWCCSRQSAARRIPQAVVGALSTYAAGFEPRHDPGVRWSRRFAGL